MISIRLFRVFSCVCESPRREPHRSFSPASSNGSGNNLRVLAYLECPRRRSCNQEASRRPCDTWPPVCRPEESDKSALASSVDTCKCRWTPALSTRSRWTVSRSVAIAWNPELSISENQSGKKVAFRSSLKLAIVSFRATWFHHSVNDSVRDPSIKNWFISLAVSILSFLLFPVADGIR